jgi:hypothetical protein
MDTATHALIHTGRLLSSIDSVIAEMTFLHNPLL